MLDCARVGALLPQGHPMRLVDRVLAVVAGESIEAIKAISVSEPCYRHVSRAAPMECYAYPVPLLLESFGQAAAVLWMETLRARKCDTSGEVLMFAVARDCIVEQAVFPGDLVRHRVRLDNIVGNNVFVTGSIWVDERRIATIGSMAAAVRSREEVLGRSALDAVAET